MNRKREKSVPIKNRFAGIFGFGDSYGADGMDISIQSNKCVYVDGCIGIEEFTDSVVIFLGKREKAIVKGENIELYTFENGCIRGMGAISSVEILREARND